MDINIIDAIDRKIRCRPSGEYHGAMWKRYNRGYTDILVYEVR